MNLKSRKIISIALVFFMMLTILPLAPVTAHAASGAGTETDPYIVSTFAELKDALEGTTYKYVKIPSGTTIDEVYTASEFCDAITINGTKHLIVDGKLIVYASQSGKAVNSLFSVGTGDWFEISGGGSVTFKANSSTAFNALLYAVGGYTEVIGTTLKGSYNGATYGMAVYNGGGQVVLNGGNYIGETATSDAPYQVIYAKSGTTILKEGATVSGSFAELGEVSSRIGDGRFSLSSLRISNEATVYLADCNIEVVKNNSSEVVACYSVIVPTGKVVKDYLYNNVKYQDTVKSTGNRIAETDYGTFTSGKYYCYDEARGLFTDIAVIEVKEAITEVTLPLPKIENGSTAQDLTLGALTECTVVTSYIMNGLDKGMGNVSNSLSGDVVLDPANDYCAIYRIVPNEGYEFASEEELTVTVNNGVLNRVEKSGDERYVFVNFPKQEATEKLGFENKGFNVPAGEVGTEITAIDVSSGVTGGTEPYKFSMYHDYSTVKWLQVSADGKITGTRPSTAQAATSAYIQVKDANNKTNTVQIQIGAVTEAPEPLGFVNNGFNVPAGKVGTAITAIDVSSGVTGGTEPYTFSMYHDYSTEKWLQVSADGKITGTRPSTAQAATSAYIQVKDANNKTNTVQIQIGAVTEASEETVTLTNVPDITITGAEVKTAKTTFNLPEGSSVNSEAKPKLYRVVGEEQTHFSNVSVVNNSELCYDFSKTQFTDGVNSKTFKFAINVAGTWYYSNEFTVTYSESGTTPHECSAADGWKYSETEHWKICKDDTCKKEIAETREAHHGGTATCKAQAVCEDCGQSYGVYGEHDYGTKVEAQPAVHTPTELKAGMEAHYFCDVCDTYFTEEKAETTLAALTGTAPAHSYGAWVNTDTAKHWKECSCGLKTEEAAHVYDNSKDATCNVCEYTRTISSGSSSGGGFSGSYNYPVIVGDTDGADVAVSDDYAVKGEKITITVKPDAGEQVDEVIVTDKDGKVIPVTKTGDNEYTFTMPASKVTVDVATEAADYGLRIVMQINNKNILVNGKTMVNDVAPVIVGDRTLVPIRVVTELLGGSADWDNATRTVTLKIDGKTMNMTIGKEIPGFGTSAVIMNDRTYVPVRYVMEKLGAEVEWINATRQIIIEK